MTFKIDAGILMFWLSLENIEFSYALKMYDSMIPSVNAKIEKINHMKRMGG